MNQQLIYGSAHDIDLGHAVHDLELARRSVMLDERDSLGPIGRKPRPECFGVVIRPDRLTARRDLRQPALNSRGQNTLICIALEHHVELEAISA
jgi:hypothetical protein